MLNIILEFREENLNDWKMSNSARIKKEIRWQITYFSSSGGFAAVSSILGENAFNYENFNQPVKCRQIMRIIANGSHQICRVLARKHQGKETCYFFLANNHGSFVQNFIITVALSVKNL